ncbi:hypothetical protein [Saccharothrix algeriensis]|uniref:Uncharacterized protein n=1 Tax=Saccharothrix algeriensis TaxID=173560 RepID=A0ABS2S1W2_9PSEU|nr:hypothetical protein [Saccharothrix algeriensis]MBM7809899.1 hypothetical protein [Saccharothrix algeriensis]
MPPPRLVQPVEAAGSTGLADAKTTNAIVKRVLPCSEDLRILVNVSAPRGSKQVRYDLTGKHVETV